MTDSRTRSDRAASGDAPSPRGTLRSALLFWGKALLIALMAAAAYCMATPGDPFFYQAF